MSRKSAQNMSSNAEPRCELYLDELTLGAAGVITVMICRSWDVHTLTGRYVSTNFVMSDAKSNKKKYRIFRDHTYMIEPDGVTSVRKASVKSGGSVRYPFQLIPLDVARYITNVGRINHQKSDSRTLDFSLANGSEDEVSLSQVVVHADYSQAKEGTLENLLIWARNRKNDSSTFKCRAKIDDIRSRKGWNFSSCGGEKYVSDKTASTVVVMFDEPAKELLKCSADFLAAADDESGFGYADHVVLPLALANIIGTTHTLEMKSHTYYEHGTFESFTCWRIAPEEVVDVDSESSNMNTSADVNITKVKRLPINPFVATPSKPTGERGKGRLEDSDDEVTCDMDDGGADGKESSLADKKKKKRYIMDGCDSA
nr:hypothetical protein [Tanacetum cinerariifolium]